MAEQLLTSNGVNCRGVDQDPWPFSKGGTNTLSFRLLSHKYETVLKNPASVRILQELSIADHLETSFGFYEAKHRLWIQLHSWVSAISDSHCHPEAESRQVGILLKMGRQLAHRAIQLNVVGQMPQVCVGKAGLESSRSLGSAKPDRSWPERVAGNNEYPGILDRLTEEPVDL